VQSTVAAMKTNAVLAPRLAEPGVELKMYG
jgi:hypothetical protein